jgi:excisionase family DNA binding protein
MTELAQFSAVAPTPTGVIRAVRDRLDALERDLAGARTALATAEAELIAAKTDATPEPVALTTDQVAHMLGLSRSTVTAMIGRRELASIKVGGSRRVLRRDLDRYLAEVAAGGAA